MNGCIWQANVIASTGGSDVDACNKEIEQRIEQ